jgi:hypothetical protein
VILRSDSAHGRSPAKDLGEREALEFLSQFAAHWEQTHSREPQLNAAFVVSGQQELRFRERIANGLPPIPAAKEAWDSLSRLLKGPRKLHSGRVINGDDGTGVSIFYADGKSTDILVVNRLRTCGAYGDEIRDRIVRVYSHGSLCYRDPHSGETRGKKALAELNYMIRQLLKEHEH